MAGVVWDWPNQQVVRGSGAGPGIDTPEGGPTDIIITYGHAGRSYEFLLKMTNGHDVLGGPINWTFGDGGSADAVPATTPATHTYAAADTYSVRAERAGATRSLTLEVA